MPRRESTAGQLADILGRSRSKTLLIGMKGTMDSKANMPDEVTRQIIFDAINADRIQKNPMQMPVEATSLVKKYYAQGAGGEVDQIDADFAQVIAQAEVKYLDPRLEDKRVAIEDLLRQIAEQSAQTYFKKVDEEKASEAGIEFADQLVKLVLDTEVSAKSLGEKVNLDNLIAMVIKNIPGLTTDLFNRELLKQHIFSNIPSWYEQSQKQIIEMILGRSESLSHTNDNPEVLALELAVIGVHDSWAGMQGRRSAWDENQQSQCAALNEEENLTLSPVQITQKYPGLRIFKPTFRPLAVMEQEKFLAGLEENSIEKGLALAILEVLNDLVHFV